MPQGGKPKALDSSESFRVYVQDQFNVLVVGMHSSSIAVSFAHKMVDLIWVLQKRWMDRKHQLSVPRVPSNGSDAPRNARIVPGSIFAPRKDPTVSQER